MGVQLWVKRDDLLPFPLAGNKVRKLAYEAGAAGWCANDVLITNGGVDSNHCRTVAFMAARLGAHAHLVLHSEVRPSNSSASLTLMRELGANFDVVKSGEIASTIAERLSHYRGRGCRVHVIPGGAHTPAGVRAYVAAGLRVLSELDGVDHIVVASGTGATQAGLSLAALQVSHGPRVTGVSVARGRARGESAVRQAIAWVEPLKHVEVDFDDRFVDGGYGAYGNETRSAVQLAWASGLPLDTTYTGKAFNGLLKKIRFGEISPGATVLFWHTGGLMNYLASTVRPSRSELAEDLR